MSVQYVIVLMRTCTKPARDGLLRYLMAGALQGVARAQRRVEVERRVRRVAYDCAKLYASSCPVKNPISLRTFEPFRHWLHSSHIGEYIKGRMMLWILA